MPAGVRTQGALEELVDAYSDFDEFVFDIESKGPYRGDPRRNDVFWISLAGPGRADVIPCGHPLGERVEYEPEDDLHRIHPKSGKYQEKVFDRSAKGRWDDVPDQFYDPPQQLWMTDVIEALRPLFYSDRRKVGQMVKFDLQSIAKYYKGEIPPPPYGDTLLAARLINENEYTFDLGALTKRAFKFEYDKIGKKGVETFPYSEAYQYSFFDAKYTWLLWVLYKQQMAKEKVRQVFDMEMEAMPAVIDMEWTGIAIDSDVLDELGDEFSMEMARHKVFIEKANGGPINLNASAQLIELVYEKLGHVPRNYTEKTGVPSTSADDLEHYIKDPVVEKILDYKKLGKLQSTFIEGIRRNTIDGRVHPTFNQMQAVTGRASCSEPNIQQIPSRSERSKRVRDVFVAQR